MTREDHIDNACDSAGCTDKDRKRHASLFLHERWDPHPPPDFTKYWSRNPESRDCKPQTAWNTHRNRLDFKAWMDGKPL